MVLCVRLSFLFISKKDRDALERCMELGYEFPEITTWIRATKSDFELVKNIGIRETGILVSCSDYHIFKKMNLTRKQAMEKYLGVISDAIEAGLHQDATLKISQELTIMDLLFRLLLS